MPYKPKKTRETIVWNILAGISAVALIVIIGWVFAKAPKAGSIIKITSAIDFDTQPVNGEIGGSDNIKELMTTTKKSSKVSLDEFGDSYPDITKEVQAIENDYKKYLESTQSNNNGGNFSLSPLYNAYTSPTTYYLVKASQQSQNHSIYELNILYADYTVAYDAVDSTNIKPLAESVEKYEGLTPILVNFTFKKPFSTCILYDVENHTFTDASSAKREVTTDYYSIKLSVDDQNGGKCYIDSLSSQVNFDSSLNKYNKNQSRANFVTRYYLNKGSEIVSTANVEEKTISSNLSSEDVNQHVSSNLKHARVQFYLSDSYKEKFEIFNVSALIYHSEDNFPSFQWTVG